MSALSVQHLGRVDYAHSFAAMRAFVHERAPDADEALWLCEHEPVFVLGPAGRPKDLLLPDNISIIASNRNGQISYHGPGQVVAYPLVHLQRRGWRIKEYVHRLEEATLRTLAHWSVTGHRVPGAPGIYVRPDHPFDHAQLPQRPNQRITGSLQPQPDFSGLAKIATLGIKLDRNWCSHGLALNVAMDLEPYTHIDSCGHPSLPMVDLSALGVTAQPNQVANVLATHLLRLLAA